MKTSVLIALLITLLPSKSWADDMSSTIHLDTQELDSETLAEDDGEDDEDVATPRTWTLSPEIGLSYVELAQGAAIARQSSLDARVHFTSTFVEKWTLGAEVGFFLAPVTRSGTNSFWQFDAMATAIRSIHLGSSGWDLGLGFGPVYETQFTHSAQLGFRDFVGLSLAPSFIRPVAWIAKNDRFGLYARGTPGLVSRQFAFEWSPGIYFETELENLDRLGFTLEYRNTFSHPNPTEINRTSRLGASVSYSF